MRETNEIISVFKNILNWASENGKYPDKYGIEEPLYLTEIHTIEIIGKNPAIISADLCRRLEVTKGRISMLIRNLEKKGLIEKKKSPSNKKEIQLFLTAKGEIAFKAHETNDKNMIENIKLVFEQFSQEEINKFSKALIDIKNILK